MNEASAISKVSLFCFNVERKRDPNSSMDGVHRVLKGKRKKRGIVEQVTVASDELGL